MVGDMIRHDWGMDLRRWRSCCACAHTHTREVRCDNKRVRRWLPVVVLAKRAKMEKKKGKKSVKLSLFR